MDLNIQQETSSSVIGILFCCNLYSQTSKECHERVGVLRYSLDRKDDDNKLLRQLKLENQKKGRQLYRVNPTTLRFNSNVTVRGVGIDIVLQRFISHRVNVRTRHFSAQMYKLEPLLLNKKRKKVYENEKITESRN